MSEPDEMIVLRAARWLDVVAGEVRSPAAIVVDGNRIVAVDPAEVPRRRRGFSTSVTSRSCPA